MHIEDNILTMLNTFGPMSTKDIEAKFATQHPDMNLPELTPYLVGLQTAGKITKCSGGRWFVR